MMLFAMAALAVMDATMKELSSRYPALQIAAIRGLLTLPIIISWVYLRERGFRTLGTTRWGLHLVRGLLAIIMMTTLVYGISQLPLSEVYALYFISPLLITALSVPFLGEVVGPRRWMAVMAGFCGVMIVLQPGIVAINLASVAVLISAACYAINALSVRVLGRTDSAASMTFWFFVVLAVGAGLLSLPNWQPVRIEDAGWLIGLAIAGGIGQFLITAAFRCAPISVVAPFEYSILFWGIALDVVLWGKLPAMIVFVGAAVVAGSGLYLIYRERMRSTLITPTEVA